MRFQEYLLERKAYKKKTRSKIISLDEIRKIIPQYSQAIKAAMNNKDTLVRETNVSSKNIYILDPKKGEKRKSRNTSNYYTLLLDHSKRWAKYPKRSKSIICETRILDIIHTYQFWVIPKNGAKIGECPADDFWDSFRNVIHTMMYFNNSLEKILSFPNYSDEEIEGFESAFSNKLKIKSFDKNITEFKKACKNFDNWFNNISQLTLDEIMKVNILSNDISNDIDWLKNWDGKSIFNYIDKILDPKENDFKLKSINNLSSHKEAWTDSESLIVPAKYAEDIINIYKEI